MNGIIAKTHADRQIALFYTGTQHAGENLTSLLTKRLDDNALDHLGITKCAIVALSVDSMWGAPPK